MGKSYKKPIIKDKNKSAQKLSHSKFRKQTKQKIQVGKFDEIPEDLKELTNPYDVSDFKFVVDKEDDNYEESKRK